MATKGLDGIDLESWSLDELKKLHRSVGKAIETFETRRKQEALAALEDKAREFGFALSDLMGSDLAKAKKTGGVPKYRHPENPAVTWSGRGRQPGWIKQAMAKGQSMAAFLIGK